jgi:hypothetical protein
MNIIDIIEQSQTRHALKKENELKDLKEPSYTTVALVEETGIRTPVSDIDGVRVSTITIRASTKWQPPRDGHDRLVVMFGKTNQLLERDCATAVPARWAWVPASSACKMINAGNQHRRLMIFEFAHTDEYRISARQEVEGEI